MRFFYFLIMESLKMINVGFETIAEEVADLLAGREVVIEAGHFYSKTKPSEQQANQIKHSSELATEIAVRSKAKRVVFVDDFNEPHGQTKAQDSGINASKSWKMLDASFAGGVDFVYLESLMMTRASGIVSELSSKGKIVDNGYACVLKGDLDDPSGVTLVQYRDGQGIPTCALLDAACYTLKGEMYPDAVQVTILPHDYVAQQQKTKKVLESIGDKTEILNLYID